MSFVHEYLPAIRQYFHDTAHSKSASPYLGSGSLPVRKAPLRRVVHAIRRTATEVAKIAKKKKGK